MIPRRFDDAVHLLVTLAGHAPDSVGSATLAAHLHAEPTLVRRLLRDLARAGLVSTRRGVEGGSALAQPPEAIDLERVMTALETAGGSSIHRLKPRPRRPGRFSPSFHLDRALGPALARADQAFRSSLATTTLADLLHDIRRLRHASAAPRRQALRDAWATRTAATRS